MCRYGDLISGFGCTAVFEGRANRVSVYRPSTTARSAALERSATAQMVEKHPPLATSYYSSLRTRTTHLNQIDDACRRSVAEENACLRPLGKDGFVACDPWSRRRLRTANHTDVLWVAPVLIGKRARIPLAPWCKYHLGRGIAGLMAVRHAFDDWCAQGPFQLLGSRRCADRRSC